MDWVPAGTLSLLAHTYHGVLAASGENAATIAFVAAFVETLIGVGVLIPGGTAVILAGFAARQAGATGFLEVAFAAAAGMTMGAVVDYGMGRIAGRRLVPKWAPWRLAMRWRYLLRQSHRFMDRWGWWAILAASLAGPGRSSIAIAAGASGWSFPAFLAGQSVAAGAWSALYVGIGFFAARESERLHMRALISGAGIAIAALLLFAVFGPPLLRYLARRARRWLAATLRPPTASPSPPSPPSPPSRLQPEPAEVTVVTPPLQPAPAEATATSPVSAVSVVSSVSPVSQT